MLDRVEQHAAVDGDDLCLRVRDAGWRLAVARAVYVHHFGGRTFAGLGLDSHALLAEGFRTAHYRMPPSAQVPGVGAILTAPVTSAVRKRPSARVSLCLIVKDEQVSLPSCLAGLPDLFHEVVVVDTGSRDRPKELARELGAKVFDFPWVDSFAAARDECLRRAEGDDVFWLDADDRLDPPERDKLVAALARLDGSPVGYLMACLCPPESAGESPSLVEHLRLFRKLPCLS